MRKRKSVHLLHLGPALAVENPVVFDLLGATQAVLQEDRPRQQQPAQAGALRKPDRLPVHSQRRVQVRGEPDAGGEEQLAGGQQLRREDRREVQPPVHVPLPLHPHRPLPGDARAGGVALEPAHHQPADRVQLPHEGQGHPARPPLLPLPVLERHQPRQPAHLHQVPLRVPVRPDAHLQPVRARVLHHRGHRALRQDPAGRLQVQVQGRGAHRFGVGGFLLICSLVIEPF